MDREPERELFNRLRDRYHPDDFEEDKKQWTRMKKKNFLKLPEYPGGKEEFRRYIEEHLVYPENALNQHVEGIVYVSANVDDDGNISEVHVEKGIGFGCDEEAIRLIKGIHFGGVNNRGVRVKTVKKFRVQFRIKKSAQEKETNQVNICYDYKETANRKNISETLYQASNSVNKYSYTINLNPE